MACKLKTRTKQKPVKKDILERQGKSSVCTQIWIPVL